MTTEDRRARARALRAEFAATGDHLGWFEALYREARDTGTPVPWADFAPNARLVEWCEQTRFSLTGRRCLVVGCGLGDDAEYLAAAGGEVAAFDISPTALDVCRSRFPASRVKYIQANLLAPPHEWRQRFDFAFEAYTLQVLPVDIRRQAWPGLAACLAPGGTLLLLCRGRDDDEPLGELPWALSREELSAAEACGLQERSFEEYLDSETPPVRRFRIVYRRP